MLMAALLSFEAPACGGKASEPENFSTSVEDSKASDWQHPFVVLRSRCAVEVS